MRPYLRSLEIRLKKDTAHPYLLFAMERHPYSFAPVAFGEADAGRRIKNVLNFKNHIPGWLRLQPFWLHLWQ